MNSTPGSGFSVNYDSGSNKPIMAINLLVIIACFAGAFYFYANTQDFLKTAEVTDGEVIRFNESRHDGETRYTAVFRFTAVSGITIEFQSNTHSNRPSHAIGDIVEILYNPDDPNNARLNSTFGMYGFSIVFGILGTGAVLFFAGNQANLNKRRQLTWHLSSYGKPYETTFTGVKRVSKGKNNQSYYYITSSRVFDDITREFRSEEFRKNPELHEDMPETIVVIADPDSLNKYAMDTSFLPEDVFKPTIRIASGPGRLEF